jgi:putative ABC transport system permease protein
VEAAAFLGEPGLLLMSEATAAGDLPGPAAHRHPRHRPTRRRDHRYRHGGAASGPDRPRLPDRRAGPARRPAPAETLSLRLEPPEAAGDVARLTDSFHLNLTAFGLLSFGVGLFIVHAAIGLAFEQRRAVFRTLRAVGLPLRTLMAALAVEIAAMALVAGSIGIALGYAIAAALMPGVAGTLRGLYGASVPGTLTFDPVWAVSGLGDHASRRGAASAAAMTGPRACRFWRRRSRAPGRRPPTARCGCRRLRRWPDHCWAC